MPGRDGTGPQGQGPLTGRGAGYCNDDKAVNKSFFGYGRGRGAGRGFYRIGRGGRVFGYRGLRRNQNTPNNPREI